MKRTLFGAEHELFRGVVADFFACNVVPEYHEWESAGQPPRHFWLRAGELGLLGLQVPEQYGGGGQDSFLFNVILTEEAQRAGLALGGLRVHTDICMPYFLHFGTTEQQACRLPRLVSGEAVAALAMSEPGAGSDIRAIATTATRDGDDFILNGTKTFISNGRTAGLIIVAAKTVAGRGRDSLSLLVVEGDSPGLSRGRALAKMGLKAQDLAELFFADVRVPARDVLGQVGEGFAMLSHNLVQERLSIAVNSQAAAVKGITDTIAYVTSREAFGAKLSSRQNTKFELAACATEAEAGQALLDKALAEHESGGLSAADAAMVKLFCTEMQGRVLDRCLQLFGGYGYVLDYPIARAYTDARVSRIYAGSSEVMKTIVSKSMGLS